MSLDRDSILPETALPDNAAILAAGRAMAAQCPVGPSVFLDHVDATSEADFKRRESARGRIMQHAQIGFRDADKTRRAYREIYEACRARGVTVDRYGICLDWSMGYPRDMRERAQRGTGLILDSDDAFAELTAQAPVAAHFGDFVLGFPAAVENTRAALKAGSTAIGNIGQCFTFRLPGYHDDIAAMEATVTALALIAAQDREVLVQSNLDDGFAALFGDLSSSIGAVLLEKHIVETLIGATISHCYGHHFSDPLRRIAFHLALSRVSDAPGTMVYGNTTSYVGTEAQNYASLSAYLQADIHGQHEAPTGHAINPVPVSENDRIPDIDEIIDAQLFAARMIDRAEGYRPLCDLGAAHDMADALVAGGIAFRDRALAGLHAAGIDTDNAFEMLLSLRRIGGRALETAFGSDAAGDGTAIVTSPVVEEVAAIAEQRLARVDPQDRARIAEQNMAVIVATTDVHEHGKLVVERLLRAAGVKVHDGGVSVDADRLVAMARTTSADAIAISTYNGVALDYIGQVFAELDKAELDLPVLIGGRMNQIPDGSNTSLPVDVTAEIVAAGATICHTAEDVVPALLATARDGHER